MDTLENRTVTIRKVQHCHGCAREFQPPAQLRLCVTVDQGDFCRAYICKVCDAYIAEVEKVYSGAFDDGWFYGDVHGGDPEGREHWERVRAEIEQQEAPTPGTAAAIAAGCTCPVADNQRGDGMYWHSGDCPVHGKESDDE